MPDIELSQSNEVALRIWNLMGSEMDWSALDVLAEYYRVDDVEMLIDSLIHLKTHHDKLTAANR